MSKFSRIITLVTLVSIVMGGLSLGVVVATTPDPPPGVPAELRTCRIRDGRTASILYDGVSPCPAAGQTANLDTGQAICCVFDTLYTVTSWIFWAVMLLVMLFIILGAFFIITAGGNDEKVGKGKKFIIFAVVGAIVGMMARIIPGLAAAMMGLAA